MKYAKEKLEQMTKNDFVNLYRKSSKSERKQILKTLENSDMLMTLMSGLDHYETYDMIRICPNRDSLANMIIYDTENNLSNDVNIVIEAFSKRNFKDRISSFFGKNNNLSSKKIQDLQSVLELKGNRKKATGKKYEALENQKINEAVSDSRVDVKNSLMSKVFDKYAVSAVKEGRLANGNKTSENGSKLINNLKEEYINVLGTQNTDFAKLIANAEFENNSGLDIFMPYSPNARFSSGEYEKDSRISGIRDSRQWQKNLLEIEKVENFKVDNKDIGEVYIVKSEFSPTSYAIQDKWAPIYEYFTKNENGEFVRIGSGKLDDKTGDIQSIIDGDKSEVNSNNLDKLKDSPSKIEFNLNEYSGKSTKISRKDIEQKIAINSIKKHIGDDKIISDIVRVNNLQKYKKNVTTAWDPDSYITSDAYIISYLDNGVENYDIVCINENGLCESFQGMNILEKQDLNFDTGVTTGYDRTTSLSGLETKKSLMTFEINPSNSSINTNEYTYSNRLIRDNNNSKFSIYRNLDGSLGIAQIMTSVNGKSIFPEVLDTYNLIHNNVPIQEKNNDKKDVNTSKISVIQEKKNQLNAIRNELESSIQVEENNYPKL